MKRTKTIEIVIEMDEILVLRDDGADGEYRINRLIEAAHVHFGEMQGGAQFIREASPCQGTEADNCDMLLLNPAPREA
jgi:hypothetical protein